VAGAALAGCGDDSGGGTGLRSPRADIARIKFLLAYEHALVAAYAVGEELVRGRTLRGLRAIAAHERQHVRLLTELVRDLGATPAGPRHRDEYRRSFPRMRDRSDFLTFAADLEEHAVRQYLESLARLSDRRLRRTAAALGVEEAQHLGSVHLLSGEPAATEPFVTGTS